MMATAIGLHETVLHCVNAQMYDKPHVVAQLPKGLPSNADQEVETLLGLHLISCRGTGITLNLKS